jgi:ABC-2 type transport system ATP-binding protein
MSAVFRWDQVVKQFGSVRALDKLSLEAEPGVVVALLGENGAGKTTALRILLGLERPDSGRSEVLGRDSQRDGDAIRRRVGFVPDRPTLYDWMTVGETGWFAAGFHDAGFLPQYQKLIAQFQVAPEQKIKHLSKGMRSKVSLALAMAHEPPLLVLDEPTSGLDPLVRREFLESMVAVAAAGRTVLLSSHQIAEVERVADVVAILNHGRLVLVERLEDLKRRTRELTVTLRNGAPDIPPVPGTVLRREQADRHWRLLVRDLDEGQLAAFQAGENVQHIDLRTPSLEEIFVGYMRGT